MWKAFICILLLLFTIITAADPEVSGNESDSIEHVHEPLTDTIEVAEQNNTSHNKTHKVACLLLNDTVNEVPIVHIVNSTRLVAMMNIEPNITSFLTPAHCLVVLFYSPSCPFSCSAAPHFNALPRAFPNLTMAALDTSKHTHKYNFNAQFGILGVPSLLIFHNGRPLAIFNHTSDYSLESFAIFLSQLTGIKPKEKVSVTSLDFSGPISAHAENPTDYCLWLSWIFIWLCSAYWFYYSSWCQWLVDSVRSAWVEAQAHQHVD